MEIQAPKGTRICFHKMPKWQYVEGVLREVSKAFGVREIRNNF